MRRLMCALGYHRFFFRAAIRRVMCHDCFAIR